MLATHEGSGGDGPRPSKADEPLGHQEVAIVQSARHILQVHIHIARSVAIDIDLK